MSPHENPAEFNGEDARGNDEASLTHAIAEKCVKISGQLEMRVDQMISMCVKVARREETVGRTSPPHTTCI